METRLQLEQSIRGGLVQLGRTGVGGSFTVPVPAHFSVKASTSGGDIEVADIFGVGDGRTIGGDIELVRIEGRVDAVASGGDIEVEAGRGKMSVSTSEGDGHVEYVDGIVNASTSG